MLCTRDVHMIIEGQGLKVRKGQHVRAQNFFQALITQYVDKLEISKQSTYRKLTT